MTWLRSISLPAPLAVIAITPVLAAFVFVNDVTDGRAKVTPPLTVSVDPLTFDTRGMLAVAPPERAKALSDSDVSAGNELEPAVIVRPLLLKVVNAGNEAAG